MIGLDDTVLNYVRKLRSDEIKKSLPVRWVYVGIIALRKCKYEETRNQLRLSTNPCKSTFKFVLHARNPLGWGTFLDYI